MPEELLQPTSGPLPSSSRGRGGRGPPNKVLPLAPSVGGTLLWASQTHREAVAVMISPPLLPLRLVLTPPTRTSTPSTLVSKSSINNKEIKEGSEVVPLLSLNSSLALLIYTQVFNKIRARVFFDLLK
ncbi:hypothetical protein Sjap_025899 [Stephania japonica]|uniref:Uncharacterized protein n=1 Tax=Stephania japonica TaxID=461633 RepID=A0AAP0E5P4_9MAGN